MSDTQTPQPPDGHLHSLLDPEHCAVLLQELQEGVVGSASGLPELAQAVQESALIPNALMVVQAARRLEVPVVHCTAENIAQGFGANTNARLFAAARKRGM